MTKLIACCLFAFTACHHDAPPQNPQPTTTTSADDDGPDVDPTMPSWAPRSCKGYHAAVVMMANCNDVDASVRSQVSAKYEADNKGWHDLTNAQQSDLDQVGTACKEQRKSVRDQMNGKCSNVQPVSSLE
ncbi:MAG: hypothetical protein ABI591_32180 [Kofleriaceae bacterium]